MLTAYFIKLNNILNTIQPRQKSLYATCVTYALYTLLPLHLNRYFPKERKAFLQRTFQKNGVVGLAQQTQDRGTKGRERN
jgi:hypothetical protein